MKRGQFVTLVAAVVLSGFLGGALSERIFSAGEAMAARDFSMPDAPLTEITVPRDGFLFKSNGRVVAKITGSGDGGALVLYGGDGMDRVRLSAGRNAGALIMSNGPKTAASLGINGANVLLSMKSNGGNNITLESKRNAGSMRLVGGKAHFIGQGYNVVHPSRAETAATERPGAAQRSTAGAPTPSGTGQTDFKRMVR